MVGKTSTKKLEGKDMKKIEVGWIQREEFEKVSSEATARMIGYIGKTCHIKGQSNYRRG